MNRTPPMMFSHNPAFRLEFGTKSTQKQKENLNRLNEFIRKWRVDRSQLCWLDGRGKHYCSESKEIIKLFYEKNHVPSNSLIFTDGGSAWGPERQPEILKYGVTETKRYPSVIHHLASPNDNRLHGSAKQLWRSSKDINMGDDVDRSLGLLHFLTAANSSKIKADFERDLFIGGNIPCTIQICENIITDGKIHIIKSNEKFKERLKKY